MQNIASTFVLFILVIFTFTISGQASTTVKYNVENVELIDYNIFFMNFLKSKVQGKTFRDMFVDSYYLNDFDAAIEETEKFFERVKTEKCPISTIDAFLMPENKPVKRIYTDIYYTEFPEALEFKEVSEIDVPLREPGKYLRFTVTALC